MIYPKENLLKEKDVSNIRGGRQGKNNEEESNYRERENKSFLQGEYTVEKIATKLGQNYTLEGFNRPLLRHELSKI